MTPGPTPRHDRPPIAAMTGIIATVTVYALAQGLTYPLLSFLLERQGTSPALIGLSAAMTQLGFILSSPFIPALTRRLGARRLALVCPALAALTLSAIALVPDVWAWMPLRFLLGVFVNPLYVISETWLIAITPAARRGRILGLYSSIVSAGFALGPLSLGIVGITGWPPFAIGIAAFLICGLIILSVLPRLPAMPTEGEAASVGGFFAQAPLLLFAVFTAACFEQSLLSLLAVYGASLGSPEARVAALIACFVAGNAMLQVVLGRASERFGSGAMMRLCVVVSAAGCALLPFAFATAFAWPFTLIWGGFTFGIYTIALVRLGERFSGQALIAGNAAFAVAWGVGGMAGSPAAGLAMQLVGPHGLPAFLALLCLGLAVPTFAARRPARTGV